MTPPPQVSTPAAMKPKPTKRAGVTKPKKTKKSKDVKGSKVDNLSSQIMAMSEEEFNNIQQKPFERPLAEATIKKYNKHSETYINFCKKHNFSPNGLSVLKYLITCKELGATAADIKQYHSAIMNYFTTTLKVNLKQSDGYATVITLLKDVGKQAAYNNDVVQAGVFTREDLIKIWKFMATIPKTPRMVQILAIWTWQLFTLFRCDDLTQMMWENLVIDETNKTMEVHLNGSKTGPADATITANDNDPSMSAYHIMLDYVKLIPLADRTGRVWKRWVDKKGGGYFSTAQPVGKNNFTKLLRELFLECLSVLPEQIQWEEQNQRRKDGCQDPGTRFGIGRFTSHSARRTMTTIAAASESISNTELQRLGRWSNALTMERYKDNNSAVRINTQKKLGAIFTLDVGNLHAGTATGVTAVMSDPAKALAELGLVFNNCTVSITINRDTAAQ